MKNGEIHYQQKKFDVNWGNYSRTGKRHLVNFLIRDHYSNCFYAETHPIDEMPHLKEFLFNAWKEKEDFEFCGIPNYIIGGKHIVESYPDILNFCKNTNCTFELATSGFATGIRSVRDWEKNIKYFTLFENLRHIDDFQSNSNLICREINLRDSGKTEPNLKKWIENISQVKSYNTDAEFYNLFL
ncbi:hypothetical protein EZL74_08520 [Flavobacterium silvisoli]|uniref:Uncharacterized protein n=1 Tax=Flavobacterium silvisoli TaxID=2529433 RepID=A0A4Q9YX15_9FLAO|nr:hypothetical protein [Flavobacterium silvisoli]TBX68345.1 hypothetical protein EZL74_08520 [Flavobacterium silvisoli]